MKISDKARVRIRLIYGVLTSVVLVWLGAAFIFSCYSIYEMGGSPFTRESIGEALSALLIPIISALALVVVGFVLSALLPVAEPTLRAKPDRRIIGEKLLQKRDASLLDPASQRALARIRTARRIVTAAALAVTFACSVLALMYALNLSNYTDELNDSVIKCTVAVAVSLSPAIAVCAVRLIVDPILTEKEIAILTAAPKRTDPQDGSRRCKIASFVSKNEKELILGSQIALVLLATVYITLGVLNGGMNDVLQKAIKICTECIGLG